MLWLSAKMTKWQNDEMTKWQNDKMTKWQNDKMTKWQNDKMTKWQKLLVQGCVLDWDCSCDILLSNEVHRR